MWSTSSGDICCGDGQHHNHYREKSITGKQKSVSDGIGITEEIEGEEEFCDKV